MISTITYSVFIERIQRRLQNDFPSVEFTLTDNEIALYITESIGAVISNTSKERYAVEGIYATPEAFITTFKINASAFTKDYDNGQFIASLPQPPLNLPLGYSIIAPYFAANGEKSMPLIAIHGFQKGYGLKMATPEGVFYEIEGDKMYLTTGNGFDLITSGFKLYIPMLSARSKTGADTDTMSLPDDAMGSVFDMVVAKLTQRISMPKDKANDGSDKKTEGS